MKKGLLLIVVMVAAIAVKAQDIYVGGSFNVWRNSTGNTTSFKVAPEIGYNFNETWALGAELDYSHDYNGRLINKCILCCSVYPLVLLSKRCCSFVLGRSCCHWFCEGKRRRYQQGRTDWF